MCPEASVQDALDKWSLRTVRFVAKATLLEEVVVI